jgi:hypothetical protein
MLHPGNGVAAAAGCLGKEVVQDSEQGESAVEQPKA